jgi:PPOX class probable F420-dependent enzyme
MDFAQARAFLESHHWGIVTTHQRDGAAQNSIVYCGAYRDQAMFVAVYGKSAKVRNLRRDPSITVCIDGARGDARYVVLGGKAELIEPGERQKALRWRIVRQYYSDEDTAARYYGTIKDNVGVIIALRPERIVLSGFPDVES